MDNKKFLFLGLLVLAIAELGIWTVLNHKKMYPEADGASLSSIMESSLNKALIGLGITDQNLVKKYWEEKTSEEKEKWVQVHEEFAVSPSVSLNEILKDIDQKIKQVGGEILSYDFIEGGQKLKITLSKGNIATHSLLISKARMPKLSIIIDDMGYGRDIEKEILALSYPLTISILPQQKDSQKTAEMAHSAGFEVLMHQPLESKNPQLNTLQGLITAEMSKDQINSVFMQNLKTVPYAVGINNHEGSKGTEQEKALSALLDAIKKEKMFFVDSLTTPDSLAQEIAKSQKLQYLERNLFLDNKKDENYITEQIEELISQALSNGQAIAIAHPNQATLNALKKALPKIEAEGVKIVPVSQLLEE